ncbi:MAG TPA: N-acetyltransferase [Vicinamibacterales bacterium]
MASIDIRKERANDIPAIREVNRRAFGSDHEGKIVDALRTSHAVSVSLVATVNDAVVGHILYSPAVVGGVEGAALGPMAVLPEHQRQGIGSQLVAAGNERLHIAGCPFVIVIGHPGFYPRFGFTPAHRLGITCEWDVPSDVFMVLVMDSQKAGALRGLAEYRPEFSTAS